MYYVEKLEETLKFTLMDANYDISYFISLGNEFLNMNKLTSNIDIMLFIR